MIEVIQRGRPTIESRLGARKLVNLKTLELIRNNCHLLRSFELQACWFQRSLSCKSRQYRRTSGPSVSDRVRWGFCEQQSRVSPPKIAKDTRF